MSMVAPAGRETRVFVFKGWRVGDGKGIGKRSKGDEGVDPAFLRIQTGGQKSSAGLLSLLSLPGEIKTEAAGVVVMAEGCLFSNVRNTRQRTISDIRMWGTELLRQLAVPVLVGGSFLSCWRVFPFPQVNSLRLPLL